MDTSDSGVTADWWSGHLTDLWRAVGVSPVMKNLNQFLHRSLLRDVITGLTPTARLPVAE